MAQQVKNLGDEGMTPGLAQWVGDLVLLQAAQGHRCSSDPAWRELSLGNSICRRCSPKEKKEQ